MSQRRKSQNQEPEKKVLSKNVKIIIWSVLGAVFVTLISVALWIQFKPEPQEPKLPKRFENIEHISTSIYNVLLGKQYSDELSEDDLKIWEEIEKNLERDVYVFIYNADYDESPDTKDLESLINEAFNREDKTYTFLVLNYFGNEEIENVISAESHGLPIRPVLVHIEGENESSFGTTFREIQAMLIGLRIGG